MVKEIVELSRNESIMEAILTASSIDYKYERFLTQYHPYTQRSKAIDLSIG
jgi:hypothetical protein